MNQDAKLKLARDLPKIELHIHLDGSLSQDFIAQQAKILGIELPVPPDELRNYFLEMKSKRIGTFNSVEKGSNWNIFDFCNQFLQTPSTIEEATVDLLERLYHWNVVYAEIRFCPTLHTLKGLSPDEVVGAALKGFRKFGKIEGGIIVCALRSRNSEHGLEMARLAKTWMDKKDLKFNVVGFDVCGDEGSFPLHDASSDMHKGAKYCQENDIPMTIHAGEWPDSKFQTIRNIRYAMDTLKARRIGHGLALDNNENDLKKLGVDQNVTIEVCLTSNVGFSFKVSDYSTHPVKKLYRNRIPFSLSCDNLLFSGDFETGPPNPGSEMLHLINHVFADEKDAWEAVRFQLFCGAESTFSKSLDPNWISDFKLKVDQVFLANGLEF